MCETRVCPKATRLAKAFALTRLAFASDRLCVVACAPDSLLSENKRHVLRSLSYLVTSRAHDLAIEFVAPLKIRRYDTTMRAGGPGLAYFIRQARGWRTRHPELAEVWDATV